MRRVKRLGTNRAFGRQRPLHLEGMAERVRGRLGIPSPHFVLVSGAIGRRRIYRRVGFDDYSLMRSSHRTDLGEVGPRARDPINGARALFISTAGERRGRTSHCGVVGHSGRPVQEPERPAHDAKLREVFPNLLVNEDARTISPS